MAADCVVCECGAVFIGVDDLAVGHQTQLDQRLEAVADTQHQTVPIIQQAGIAVDIQAKRAHNIARPKHL